MYLNNNASNTLIYKIKKLYIAKYNLHFVINNIQLLWQNYYYTILTIEFCVK